MVIGLQRGLLASTIIALAIGCGSTPGTADTDEGTSTGDDSVGTSNATLTTTNPTTSIGSSEDSSGTDPTAVDSSSSGTPACTTPRECADQAEANAAAQLEVLREDEGGLRQFLIDMPLGGDLHHHLSGSVYAETYLAWAEQDGDFCIAESNYALSTACGDGNDVPVPTGRREFYLEVVRSWSMLDFVPTPQESGADHFFAAFSKFGALSGTQHGRMLADVRRRAANENVLYIEPMLTSNSTARSLGDDVWQQQGGGSFTPDRYEAFHEGLMAASNFDASIERLTNDAQNSESIANAEQQCGSASAAAGCSVTTRYQAYISRSGSDAGVFAQMVAAYEAAIVEPRIVGLNLVGPEHGSGALSNYDQQMDMLEYLGAYYAESSPLRLSLHAGELTSAILPSGYSLDEEDHILKAVQLAGARRIGHGMDVMFESDPEGLLNLLRDRGILVEICFASNDIILEITGPEHPVHTYLERGVPVSIATDDQGIARSSMAAEAYRGVADQGLDYHEIKRMIRASLEYSFLPGPSFWADADTLTPVDACAPADGDTPVTQAPSSECQSFLEGSDRARLQRILETQFEAFESEF